MPAKSAAQKRLFDAAAHSPKFAKKVGIPVNVAKDFSEASKGMKFRKGGSTNPTQQGINKPKTHHGSIQMPNVSLQKYVGMKSGGKLTKEDSEMKKMAKGGSVAPSKMGAVKTAAPSRDGVAIKGHTKGKQVKMAGSTKGMKKGGKC